MEHLPSYIYLVFGLTALLALIIFYRASQNSKSFLVIALAWIVAQSFVSLTGYYIPDRTVPPKFPLQVVPPLLLMTVLFFIKRGREFIKHINIKTLTMLHMVRIPVELVLYWLMAYKAVPELITFEGRNFDILSGLTAPVIYYFGFVKSNLSKSVILVWNLICLALLLNVIYHAVLSAPGPFQQFAFDQPNIAIGYFPFVLLPSFIVPLVMFSHLVSIWQLLSKSHPVNSRKQFSY